MGFMEFPPPDALKHVSVVFCISRLSFTSTVEHAQALTRPRGSYATANIFSKPFHTSYTLPIKCNPPYNNTN